MPPPYPNRDYADNFDYNFDNYAEPPGAMERAGPGGVVTDVIHHLLPRHREEPPPHSGPPDDEPELAEPVEPAGEGIVPLGYDRGIYFYLGRATRQVNALTPEAHTQKALMGMASLPHYWQRSRFVSEKGHVFWDQAADWMMTACRAVGVYDPEIVRGRGAWWDEDRAVLHLGNRLLVDGVCHGLELSSTFVYPPAKSLSVNAAVSPLGNVDANKLLKICEHLRWERPISAKLLAGWVVCALVCGALRWRPSIWITGGAGSGKTWCSDNLLGPLVGPVALQVLSKTTHAGIQQRLQSDALPVIFDEFEREDSSAGARVQGVLDLMRQASSESNKVTLKGTQGQKDAHSFRIRSCFAFSSINVATSHAADESRLTVLTLRTPEKADPGSQSAFLAFEKNAAANPLGPDYAAGLLARSVGLLREIRANAETFAVAVASRMGTRRAGDQLGALLAGAFSLHSTGLITPEFAEDWLGRQEWGAETGTEVVRDEVRLMSYLMASKVRVSLGNGPTIDVTIGRLSFQIARHDGNMALAK